jgi:hypothetical protein
MGLSSRGAVGEVDTLRPPDRGSHTSAVQRKAPVSPRHQVTDESETSEYKAKNKPEKSDMQMDEATTDQNGSAKPSKRKVGSLQRSGPVLEQEQASESGPSCESNKSLPQHERIQEVEPLDISYSCTPASLKLKGVLVSRLSEVASSGRIQVVC